MSSRQGARRAARLAWAVPVAMMLILVPAWVRLALPGHVRLVGDQAQGFHLRMPMPVTVRSSQDGVLLLNGSRLGAADQHFSWAGPLSLVPAGLGQAQLDFRLLGWIPLRRMTVDVVPPVRLVPGGHSIGVVLRSRGIMVVGHAGLRGPDGRPVQPARDAGVDVGDLILRVNGTDVVSEEQVAGLVEEAGRSGRPLELEVQHRGRVLSRTVTPVRDRETGRWRVGLYIRDGAAGVGTLTFYDPATKRYGALGHVISEGETNQPIAVKSGHIVRAMVTAIEKGERNNPGEKVTFFPNEDRWLGTVDLNTRYGIFGTLREEVANPVAPGTLPVAMAAQVREGPAEIITVVRGQELERFQVQILRVSGGAADGKNLVVKITDPRLLALTQGIVQGMSGSPIVQEGRLVGAVTHVFVNDPTRGYGVLIEWMLQEAGLLSPAGQRTGSRESLPGALLPAALPLAAGSGNGTVTSKAL